MLSEVFFKRKNLLSELTDLSEFDDDEKVLVVIPDKRMPLGEWIKCPSLPVLWNAIRDASNGKFDEDNVKVYLRKQIPKIKITFPLRGRYG